MAVVSSLYQNSQGLDMAIGRRNEQGFEIDSIGLRSRSVVDVDGVKA